MAAAASAAGGPAGRMPLSMRPGASGGAGQLLGTFRAAYPHVTIVQGETGWWQASWPSGVNEVTIRTRRTAEDLLDAVWAAMEGLPDPVPGQEGG